MKKKKKDLKTIYSAVFFAMCCVPALCFPFAANRTEIGKKALAEEPQLFIDGAVNLDFAQDCEAWLTDHLPFRSAVLSAASLVKSGIFKSDTANVITGKDGWIFAEASVPDYINSNGLPDEKISSIAVSLSLLEENVTEKGGKFLFVPVPDKASVYSDFMPSRYRKADTNNLKKLQKKLADDEVSYINMLKVMSDKMSFTVYHQRDTHWNNYGALIGFNAIMDEIGKNHRTYNDADYIPEKKWRGDLDKMLYPFGGFRDYQYNLSIQFDPFEFVVPAGVTDNQAQLEIFMSDREENDRRIMTSKNGSFGSGNLYMVRDSFGRALLPFLIDNYDTALFVRSDYPDMSSVTEGTDMIYETAERNIGELFRTAPLMPAPVRTDVNEGSHASETLRYTVEEAEYGTRIYGELSKNMLSPDGRVYVRLSNEDTGVTFEAFPVYEEELLGGSGEKYGFSMIADPKYFTVGEYDVTVIAGERSYTALGDSPVSFSAERISQFSMPEEEEAPEEEEEIPAPEEAVWIDGALSDRAAIIYNDVTFAVGDNIDDIKESLGDEAAPSSAAQSCLTDEKIFEYYYAGMTVQTNEDGRIYSVEISETLHPGRTAKTAGGLCVGSSASDTVLAFGEPEESEEENSIVFEEDELKVQILMKNEKVSTVLITIPEA